MSKALCSSLLRKYWLFSKSIRKSEFVITVKDVEGFPIVLHFSCQPVGLFSGCESELKLVRNS